jgi:flagella basal body P-ring formation protein FlgA
MIRAPQIALPIVVSALLSSLPAARQAYAGTRGAEPASAAEVAPVVRHALERALAAPGARLDSAVEERGAARPVDCRVSEAEVAQPIEASGRLAVKISGRAAHGGHCDSWIWVRVRVVAPVAVAKHALRAGDSLENAYDTEERELRAGHTPAAIGPSSVVTRAVAAGQILDGAVVGEPTLRFGDVVKVLVVSGALVIEQTGRGAPCARGRSCAVLASGKQVEGELVDGRLVVQGL